MTLANLLEVLAALQGWTAALPPETRLGLFTVIVFGGVWTFRKAFPEWWEGFASRPFGLQVERHHAAVGKVLRKVWQQFPGLLSGALLSYVATGHIDYAALAGAVAAGLHESGKAAPFLRYRGATEPRGQL